MKIEIGKKYLDRNGDVIIITRNQKDVNPVFPMIGVNRYNKEYSFTEEGTYLNSKQYPKDLIEEIVAS